MSKRRKCPACGSARFDRDFEFADGEGYVCPDCDSNVFYDEIR